MLDFVFFCVCIISTLYIVYYWTSISLSSYSYCTQIRHKETAVMSWLSSQYISQLPETLSLTINIIFISISSKYHLLLVLMLEIKGWKSYANLWKIKTAPEFITDWSFMMTSQILWWNTERTLHLNPGKSCIGHKYLHTTISVCLTNDSIDFTNTAIAQMCLSSCGGNLMCHYEWSFHFIIFLLYYLT